MDESHSNSDPSAEPGDGAESHKTGGSATARGGGVLAGIGCLFAISPLVLVPIQCALRGDPGGCGDGVMLVFMTAPVGGLIAIAGLVTAVIGASREDKTVDSPADSNGEAASAEAKPTVDYPNFAVPEKPAKPRRPVDEPRTIATLSTTILFGALLVLVATIVNLITAGIWAARQSAWDSESAVNWGAFNFAMVSIPLLFAIAPARLARKLRSRTSALDAKSLINPLKRVLSITGIVSLFASFWVIPNAAMQTGSPFGIVNVLAAITPVACGLIGLIIGEVYLGRLSRAVDEAETTS